VRPVVETTMPLEDVARAHRLMEDGGRAGKIVLTL
jgi:NADPH:quinone reductase-like Zn-dependent oxidoreductase